MSYYISGCDVLGAAVGELVVGPARVKNDSVPIYLTTDIDADEGAQIKLARGTSAVVHRLTASTGTTKAPIAQVEAGGLVGYVRVRSLENVSQALSATVERRVPVWPIAVTAGVAAVGLAATVALLAKAKWGWAVANFFILTPVAVSGAALGTTAILGKRL